VPPPPAPPVISYTSLSAAEVAYFGLWVSLAVAVMAFIGALIVAAVNAWSARSLDKAKALREYRLSALQPVLDYMEQVISGLEIITFYLRAPKPDLQQAVREARVDTDKLSGMGMVSDNPELKKKWKAFKNSDNTCFEILGEVDRLRANREPLGDVDVRFATQVNATRAAAIAFRAAVEKFVF
jgi:hypothetical protein